MVRMLPTIINDLNLDRVIAEMHTFLNAFPTSTWKSRATDMPLRTIETILYSLSRMKESKVTFQNTLYRFSLISIFVMAGFRMATCSPDLLIPV